MTNRSTYKRAAMARPWIGALAVTLAVTGMIQWRQRAIPLGAFDQPFYLGIASDLRATGRYTNGFMFNEPGPAAARPSGMRFAPLYPAMLAAASTVDPALAHGMDCVVAVGEGAGPCQNAAPLMRTLQFAMLAVFYLMVWWLGGTIGQSPAASWSSLLLGLMAAPVLVRYVDVLMTEMTSLCLSTAAICAMVRSIDSTRPAAWSASAGVLLGAAALTRPGFLYLLPACAMGLAAWAVINKRRASSKRCASSKRRAGWTSAAALAGAGALTVAPWIIRNTIVLGRTALTYGYDSHTLVQRIAFDTMTWREYGLSYLCWLPDGSSMGRKLIGVTACDRFEWGAMPDTFYGLGMGPMLDETLKAAGGYDHHLGYLIWHYILPMPLWHLAVTIPLALRGAYVNHWWGLVMLPAYLWITVTALRRWDIRYLALSLPALFMLGLNAAVAVNQVRYNLILVPAYAVAGAMCLRDLAELWPPRRPTT